MTVPVTMVQIPTGKLCRKFLREQVNSTNSQVKTASANHGRSYLSKNLITVSSVMQLHHSFQLLSMLHFRLNNLF